MKRAIFTVALGAPKYVEMALGLARSLALIGDRTPRVVLSDSDDPRLPEWFDSVVRPSGESGGSVGRSPFLRKLDALTLTEAEAILFIDSDSIAFRKTDEIFDFCRGKRFAVQGAIRTEGHWYGDLATILPRFGLDGIQRFNGGLIYYERHPEVEQLVAKAAEIAADYPKTGFETFRGQVPDEPCIALAMGLTGIGELIPNEMDFMNTPVGVVGPLTMSVRRNTCEFVKRGNAIRFVRPAILHAAKYVNNWCYWRELRELERLMAFRGVPTWL